MKKILTTVMVMIAALGAFAQSTDKKTEHHFEVAKNLDIFNTLYRELDMLYVDTLDAQKLITTGIDAMLNSLDPYTEYYAEEDTSGATDVRFLSIVPDETTVSFTLSVSNAVFNADLLKLYTTKELAGNASKWTQIPFDVTSSANPITIQAQKHFNDSAFYRLAYGNGHVIVHIADTLKVDRLLLKGDNGSYYRIGVNNSGTLTATVVQ